MIVINNPQIIDLFSCKFYVGLHKGRFGIVYYNPRRSLCPLVPKQYTFSATKGSPQTQMFQIQVVFHFPIKSKIVWAINFMQFQNKKWPNSDQQGVKSDQLIKIS